METDGRYVMENNYAYSKAVFDWCQDEQVPLIYASSAAVYGAGRNFSEARENEAPLNVYAYSKFLFDQYVRKRTAGFNPSEGGPQVAGLRYFNVYGPNEAHKGRMASVAFHAYHQFRAEGRVKLFVGSDGYEDGGQQRDFIHVEDAVGVSLWLLEHREVSGIFNCGTGRAQTFNEVAAAVVNTVEGFDLSIEDLKDKNFIEYIPFPAQLAGKYQSHTQADLARLREAGYGGSFRSVGGRRRRLRTRFDENMNKTIEDFIGNTPLVRLQRLNSGFEKNSNVILAKLEGDNPAGSVKDRPAISMIRRAEERGTIRKGDVLIEPTSGNTGIGLAMAAAIRGYRMVLIMPEHLSIERRQTMRAFGAEIILTPQKGGMEGARDLAEQMVREKKGVMLDQFANPDNPRAHYETTGPEIWRDTEGRITHFVSAMGTTGTIMGCGRYFKEKNPKIQIIGCQPEEGSQIPGIRKWPEAYLPKIYDRSRVDRLEYVGQADAEDMARRLAREEGIFAGISSGGAVAVALRVSRELKNAVIVTIICDRGDRYLSTGVFPD